MRLRLSFKTSNDEFPLDYRKKFIHFIKNSLKNYDMELFNEMYAGNKMKDFTFSVYFKDSKFLKDRIIIGKDKEVTMFVLVGDIATSISLFNAFTKQKNVELKTATTSLTLERISMLDTSPVKDNKVLIKFLSPLVLQEHSPDNDYFYSIAHDNFLSIAREVVKSQLEKLGFRGDFKEEDFLIVPHPHSARKTVVRFYEKQIECSIGEFILMGSKEVLEALYLYGMGSKRSAGFGMFEIVSQ